MRAFCLSLPPPPPTHFFARPLPHTRLSPPPRFILAAGLPLQGKPVAKTMRLQPPKGKPITGAAPPPDKRKTALQAQNTKIWTLGQEGAPAFNEDAFDVLRFMALGRDVPGSHTECILELHVERERPPTNDPEELRCVTGESRSGLLSGSHLLMGDFPPE